jgi:hypothetical protein
LFTQSALAMAALLDNNNATIFTPQGANARVIGNRLRLNKLGNLAYWDEIPISEILKRVSDYQLRKEVRRRNRIVKQRKEQKRRRESHW